MCGCVASALRVQVCGGRECGRCVCKHVKWFNLSSLCPQPTPSILNCNSFLDFWVDWTDGIVGLGRGRSVGDDVILTYDLSTWMRVPINFVSISKAHPIGMWEFPNYEGVLNAFFIVQPFLVDNVCLN